MNIQPFKTSLERKSYKNSTIRQHVRNVVSYVSYLSNNGIDVTDAKHSDVADYIGTQRHRSPAYQNRILCSIRYYYQSIREAEQINSLNHTQQNPATGLYIRGQIRKQTVTPIPYKKLQDLYQWYEGTTATRKRNKVILGLLIYQGVTTEELYRIELCHIRLREAKIYITGSRRSNGRTLELQSPQWYDLQEYILQVRNHLMEASGISNTERLIITRSNHVKDILHQMFRQIKRTYPTITDAGIIRQSVISHWLKSHDVRIVQYMAGHRYVSSTERYDTSRLETLKANVNKYHPLK